MNKDVPCCQQDTIQQIRMVTINGIPTGITMLDEVISEVKEMSLPSDQLIREMLLKKVKVHNYIPKTVEEAYIKAIFAVYQQK